MVIGRINKFSPIATRIFILMTDVVQRLIFCQKILFFPQPAKKNWKKFPIFFTFRSGKLSKIALYWEEIVKISIIWGENCQNMHLLGFKLQKFANLGVKIEKKYRNMHFLGLKLFPTLPPPHLVFCRIFTFDVVHVRRIENVRVRVLHLTNDHPFHLQPSLLDVEYLRDCIGEVLDGVIWTNDCYFIGQLRKNQTNDQPQKKEYYLK